MMSEQELGRPVIPKEHGAWAVLYGSFLVGMGVAGHVTLPLALLLGGVTFLVLMNGPLTALLRAAGSQKSSAPPRHAFGWLAVYGAGACASLVPLLAVYRMIFLVPFGMTAALFFLLRLFLVRRGDDRSLPGELIGTVGLTLIGPTAHAVGVGEVQPAGAVLWMLLVLFFASGVFYVRMRIRVMLALRRGTPVTPNPARRWCVLYHLLLLLLVPALAAGQVIPWPVLLAFAPALWRAAAGLRRRETALKLRRLGWSEVALTAVFILLLTVSF
jgi:hypothetical protein